MPILIVDNTPYDYPSPGTEPGYGESATDWATAVTNLLGTLKAPEDKLQTSVPIVASAVNADVSLLNFTSSVTRAANIMYMVDRGSGIVEQGVIYLTYNGSGWDIAINSIGSANIIFNVTAGGQVRYSTNAGTGGTIRYTAKTLIA